VAFWRRPRTAADQRRTGPVGEEPWWDPHDQAFAEQPLLTRADLGKGWQAVEIPGNAERLDPYGDDPDSGAIRAVRAQRRLTALDEGHAWRIRTAGVLAVSRVEIFADADHAAHRTAWQEHGAACLDAVWRARWRERDRLPGWIEVRRRPELSTDAVDWLTVEDQTGSEQSGSVTLYEHVTIWSGRAVCTYTVRHDLADDRVDATAAAATTIAARLGVLGG
jgi:hypothetical protein